MFEKLSVSFDVVKHDIFIERVTSCDNNKLLDLIKCHDKMYGIKCNDCNDILPLYRFKQNKISLYGINLKDCIKCITSKCCPYALLYNSTKASNNNKFKTILDFDVDYIKQKVIDQNGLCGISYYTMIEEYGTGNSFNMSIERISNKIGYCKSNIMIICTWLQVGQGYDLKPEQWRDIITYDIHNDGFDFNKEMFIQSTKLIRTKPKAPTNSNAKRDINGDIISKICSDCNNRKNSNEYYSKGGKEKHRLKSICKSCDIKSGKKRKNTVRGFILNLISYGRSHCKHRGAIKGRNDTSHEMDPNLFDKVVKMIVEQNGRCLYTGIPLVYETNHIHAPTIDRIVNTKGYVEGNIQIIISPLNTRHRVSKIEFDTIRNNLLMIVRSY